MKTGWTSKFSWSSQTNLKALIMPRWSWVFITWSLLVSDFQAESMLQWTNAFCSGVKLLLKTDDDSFLIPKRVAGWLRDFDINDRWPSKSILGMTLTTGIELRIWYITMFYNLFWARAPVFPNIFVSISQERVLTNWKIHPGSLGYNSLIHVKWLLLGLVKRSWALIRYEGTTAANFALYVYPWYLIL